MTGEDRTGVAAKLRSVLFSYDMETELPDPKETEPTAADADPDARDGAILRGVNLDIPKGEFTVIMGASGGGKSTLVRCLNAVIPKHYRGTFSGQVDVLGQDATKTEIAEMARKVGMVMQDYESQLFRTSIESEVAFGPENLNIEPEEIGGRIDRILELVELDHLGRNRPPSGLSGGQKQRLILGCVLANHPELLVLDEPTSDLDPRGTRELLTLLRRLTDDGTAPNMDWSGPETFALVTHKIEEAVLADHVVLLRGGKVFREGPAKEVFRDVESLEDARVAVPPLVEAFNRLGFEGEQLPLTPAGAASVVAESDLSWTPPAREGMTVPSPAGTGENVGGVLFEVDGLSKTFHTDREDVLAVDNVDFTVREGEIVAIVGHNGSGKTTLAKHLNGLIDGDEGQVRIRGNPVKELSASEIGRSIGFVFQNPNHQLFSDTVRKELEFGPKNFGIEGEELDESVKRAAETTEIEDLLEADPFNLSKGQRQRVALASILSTDPGVIVFDEPTTGLDAPQARQFMDLVARLNREEGLTVVMITHNVDGVARYAPRTVVMENGRKVADLNTREMFADREKLTEWDLMEPQYVELSNDLAEGASMPDALPALSIDEIVEGLGGAGAVDADTMGVI